MSVLTFDKKELGNLEYSLQREMLATDRRGGYMSTTIVCCNTRKYHGLMVAPIDDSDRAYVLLSSVDETVVHDGQSFNLALHRFPGTYEPRGHKYITDFEYTPTPTITYRVGSIVLRKELLWIHNRTQLMLRRIIAFWGDLSLCSRPHFAALRLLYLTLQATVQVAYLIINIIELQFSPCTFLLPIREIFIPFPGFSRYDVPFTNHFLSSFHCFFVGFPCFPLRKCIAIPLFHYATFCFRMSDLLNTSVSVDSSKTVRLVIIVCT